MSGHHLRHDKTCLNCGHLVEERFCTHCGQENLEPKENIVHIIGHFFADITHFDSKLFITLKDLIKKPGFLTKEYVAGRRMSYLNPIRMYIFISAMFFLAIFAGRHEQKEEQKDDRQAANTYLQHIADSLRSATGDSTRGAYNHQLASLLDSAKEKPKGESLFLKMGTGEVIIDMTEYRYNTIHEFDSVQATLPDSSKEQGMMPWILRHNILQKQRHGTAKIHLVIDISHDIPKLMFILLPLFALYVRLFYSKKKYFYVNHAIFSVHYHSFIFLLFLLTVLLVRIIPGSEWTDIGLAIGSLVISFIYLVAALHGMYGQSFWLGLLKGIGITLLYVLTLSAASLALMVGSYVFL